VSEHDPQVGAVDDATLTFAEGIPGFPDARRFTLSDLTDDGTFQLLASQDHPELSLVVASPWLFFPDYSPELPATDREALELERPEDAVLFVSVTADDTDELVLNLRGPFVANARTRAARQVVLDDETVPLRAPVTAGG
jgi:flagellar assembly factor FliW